MNAYYSNPVRSLLILLPAVMLLLSCEEEKDPEYPTRTRLESIPADAVKISPENDLFPPILHSDEFEEPVPLAGAVNTAGAEDSPFIPADRNELYIFFTPDVRVPPNEQLLDSVTGIYVSVLLDGEYQNPERVWLQDPDKLALDGAEWVEGNDMLFVSAREGYTGLHWFSAEYVDERWTNWQNADFDPALDVGELHIRGDELYYHSYREGGLGQLDVWMAERSGESWQNPVNITAVNSSEDDGFPYITPDGNEMWFTRTYLGTPAIYRSKRIGGEWQDPEMIISQFAGEPTLDSEGNVYFTHHFYDNGVMLEADIYVAYRK